MIIWYHNWHDPVTDESLTIGAHPNGKIVFEIRRSNAGPGIYQTWYRGIAKSKWLNLTSAKQACQYTWEQDNNV